MLNVVDKIQRYKIYTTKMQSHLKLKTRNFYFGDPTTVPRAPQAV
jgi:hypothetical protein